MCKCGSLNRTRPCVLVDNARDGPLADPARCWRPRLLRRLALDFVGYADDAKRHSGIGLGGRLLVRPAHLTSQGDPAAIDSHTHSVRRNCKISVERGNYRQLDTLITPLLRFPVALAIEFRHGMHGVANWNAASGCE
jgi:hypothetical protein